MDYIDQDDASGDLGSLERTVYKNVAQEDGPVVSGNKYTSARIVDRSNIPKKVPKNETSNRNYRKSGLTKIRRRNSTVAGNVALLIPFIPMMNTSSLLTPASVNSSVAEKRVLSKQPARAPLANIVQPLEPLKPGFMNQPSTEEGSKKSTATHASDDDIDPFGFKTFEKEMKEQYDGRRSFIPRAKNSSLLSVSVARRG